jgi:hypothetical protein
VLFALAILNEIDCDHQTDATNIADLGHVANFLLEDLQGSDRHVSQESSGQQIVEGPAVSAQRT